MDASRTQVLILVCTSTTHDINLKYELRNRTDASLLDKATTVEHNNSPILGVKTEVFLPHVFIT